jgi:hypothetical protein
MHHPVVPEAFGQISLSNTCTMVIQHGLDEQPVVFGVHSHVTRAPGQQVFDAILLIVSKCVSSGHVGPYRSRLLLFKTAEFDDRP